MSVKIERNELVEIARSVYTGNLEIEAHLRTQLLKKPITGLFKKIEDKLWRTIGEEHPCKNFSGDLELKTRGNILRRICTVLKSKFLNFLYEGASCF